MEDLKEGWGKFHNKKLHEIYIQLNILSLNKLKKGGMGDTCRNCEEEEKRLQDFDGETQKLQTTWETYEQIRGV